MTHIGCRLPCRLTKMVIFRSRSFQGCFLALYTFDTFWEIAKRVEGQQLRGITLGVAQYVVGTFELEVKKKAGTSTAFIENEPFWLNPEAFRAARVLLKEVSSCYHQEDLGVVDWGHGFVYHPSQINFSRVLQETVSPDSKFRKMGTHCCFSRTLVFCEASGV